MAGQQGGRAFADEDGSACQQDQQQLHRQQPRQIDGSVLHSQPAGDADALRNYDRAQGFVAHRRLLQRFAERKRAIRRLRCEQACARRPWLAPAYRCLLRLREGRKGAG